MGGVAETILGAVASTVIGGLFGKKDKAPTVDKPKEAPVPDDKSMLRARERDMQRRYAGRGRASTMLADQQTNKLG